MWKQSAWWIGLAAVLGAVCLVAASNGADKKGAPGSVFGADKGKFNILLEGKSIGHEEFEIEPSGNEWLAKGSTSVDTPDGKSAKISGDLALEPNGVPLTYNWTAKTDKTNGANVVFTNGVAKTTLQMQGAAPYQQENSFGNPLVVVLDNNLYHHYELLAHIYDWSKRGSQTFPVLIPQELTPGTITVSAAGPATADGKSYETLKVSTSDLEIVLYLDPSHKLMRLEVPSGKVAVVRE
jgi:hypothetical protein